MKFAILAILIISSSFISCADAPNWQQYLAKIDLKNEPIQDEWVSKCVQGYNQCQYKGTTALWCAGSYKFTVYDGIVKPDSPTPSDAIKSLQIPKGYFVNVFGAYMSQYFLPQYASQVSSLYDGQNEVDLTTNSDIACAVQFSYWKMKVVVTSSNYVAITNLIPGFVRGLISAQTSRFNKATYTKTLTQCQSELNAASNDNNALQTSLSSYQKTKTDLETSIKILNERINTYTKIINGSLTPEQWIASTNSLKAKIDQLRAENAALDKQIADLTAKIKIAADSYTALLNKKNDFNSLINTLKGQLATAGTTLTSEITKLSTIELSLSTGTKTYTNLAQATANMETQRKSLEDQLRDIQKRMNDLDVVIDKNNCDLVTMEDQIGALVKQQKSQVEVVNQAKIAKTAIADKITATEKADTDNDVQIKSSAIARNGLDQQLLNLNTKKQNNVAEIEKNTASAVNTTKDYYKAQVLQIQSDVTNIERSLATTNTNISNTNGKISSNVIIINQKTDCVTSNTKLVTQYTTEYDTNKVVAYNLFNGIKTIFSGQISYLVKCLDNFSDALTVENYLIEAKKNLHMYLDSLPADPKIVANIQSRLDKRRRLRRRRRMI